MVSPSPIIPFIPVITSHPPHDGGLGPFLPLLGYLIGLIIGGIFCGIWVWSENSEEGQAQVSRTRDEVLRDRGEPKGPIVVDSSSWTGR